MPEGWVERFKGEADLEASYQELEDTEDGEATSMRGLVRSIQGLWKDADRLFHRAAELLVEEPPTEKTAIAATKNLVFSREARLCSGEGEPEPRTPSYWARVSCRALQGILDSLAILDAAETALAGHVEDAKAIHEEWLLANQDRMDGKAAWLLGLADCEALLGNGYDALRALEAAGLELLARPGKLSRARFSVRIARAYRWLGHHEEAAAWHSMLEGMAIPQATKIAVRRRDSLLVLARRTILA